jgi:hypothetical protein
MSFQGIGYSLHQQKEPIASLLRHRPVDLHIHRSGAAVDPFANPSPDVCSEWERPVEYRAKKRRVLKSDLIKINMFLSCYAE